MFKSAVFRIEMEFWRQRLGRYPVLALCMILLAVLGIWTCVFFTGHSTYNGYGIYGGEASEAASAGQDSLIRWHFYAASDSEEDQLLKIAVKEAVMAEAEELFAKAKTMADCRRILAANLPRLYETACRALAAEEGGLAGERGAGARPAESSFGSSQAAESSADGSNVDCFQNAEISDVRVSNDSPDRSERPDSPDHSDYSDQVENSQQIQIYYGPRYFSARQLAEGQLSSGVYETVAFVLGKGQGGNWWCLLYPPLSPGQKVVFTPVPQSPITQRAQQKYDGKHEPNPEQEQEKEQEKEQELGQEQNQAPARESNQASVRIADSESRQESVQVSGNGSDRQYATERLPVQCKLKIWEILQREK